MYWPFPSAFATWDQSPYGHALLLLFPLALSPEWVCVWCSLPPQALPMLLSQTDLLSGMSWKLQIHFLRSKQGEPGLACQKAELKNCWCVKISMDRPTWIPGFLPIEPECCFTDQLLRCSTQFPCIFMLAAQRRWCHFLTPEMCSVIIKHNMMDVYEVVSDVKQYFPHFNIIGKCNLFWQAFSIW